MRQKAPPERGYPQMPSSVAILPRGEGLRVLRHDAPALREISGPGASGVRGQFGGQCRHDSFRWGVAIQAAIATPASPTPAGIRVTIVFSHKLWEAEQGTRITPTG